MKIQQEKQLSLEGLISKNWDVFMIICAMIDPYNLEKFSRTSRSFLEWILNANALWKSYVLRQFSDVSPQNTKLSFKSTGTQVVPYLVNETLEPGYYYRLFSRLSRQSYRHLTGLERRYFHLAYANDLEAWQKSGLIFSEHQLKLRDHNSNQLWTLIRANKNSKINEFMFSQLYANQPKLEDGQLILWGIRFDQANEDFNALLDRSQNLLNSGIDDLSLLFRAASNNALNSARLLLKKGAIVNKYKDDFPLAVAAQKGYLAMVKLLVEEGKANIEETYKDIYTALYIAAENGQLAIVEYLHSQGANINPPCIPLYTAVRNHQLLVVQFLLSNGANILAKYKNSYNSIYVASQTGHTEILQLLLKKAIEEKIIIKDLINQMAVDGSTPLYVAAQNGHLSVCALLLEHGADPEITFDDGYTALYAAAENGFALIVELLMRKGARSYYIAPNGITPRIAAARQNHQEVVELLFVENSALEWRDIQENQDSNAFYMAAEKGHLKMLELVMKTCAGDRELGQQIINRVTKRNSFPLYAAINQGQLEVAQFLIEQGANIHLRIGKKDNLLHLAARKLGTDYIKFLACLQLLIPAGIDVLARDYEQKRTSQLVSEKYHDTKAQEIMSTLETMAEFWREKHNFDHPSAWFNENIMIQGFRNSPLRGLWLNLLEKTKTNFGAAVILFAMLESDPNSKFSSLAISLLGLKSATEATVKLQSYLLNCIDDNLMRCLQRYIIEPIKRSYNQRVFTLHEYAEPMLLCNFLEAEISQANRSILKEEGASAPWCVLL